MFNLSGGKQLTDLSVEGMGGKVERMETDVGELRRGIATLREEMQDSNRKLSNKLDEMAKSKTNKDAPLPSLPDSGGEKRGNEQAEKAAPASLPELSPPKKINVFKGSSDSPSESAADGKGKGRERKRDFAGITLPAGTILSGTLLTGMDAPTANQGKKDPFPALLRVKHEAILPNRYRSDIRECFLISGGHGDLSSERAFLRSERISCVKLNNEIIETSIDAFAVGEDGKAGIRGRVVSKTGQMIAQSLMAGFLSGLGGVLKPTPNQAFTINAPGQAMQTQQYQVPDAQAVAWQSAAGGIKSAADRVADYYLEMAKNTFPVIEVDAGRPIDFVLTRGARLGSKGGGGDVDTGKGQGPTTNPVTTTSMNNVLDPVGKGALHGR
ncbi:MAG: conjugal transfer protein TraB [Magnetococcales bacterium]|nr:TraB/VirB10 family protein [Magnetococcales bacterium]NGZ25384.1 conjugal transfer protein TraB [Magnetococcales bacterium]